MPNSLAKYSTPTPSIIIFRTAEMYHRAGIISEIQRSPQGILSRGNISPENIITGIISPTPETKRAAI